MTRGEAIERMRDHAEKAELMLSAASNDEVVHKFVTDIEQAMILRSAQAHATLALYWQGEVRDMVP